MCFQILSIPKIENVFLHYFLQVQSFLDHAAKVHDTKVLKGEKSPELFPKPVYEEAPFDQREKVISETREKFQKNVTSMVKFEAYDIARYNALCRGEELRVSKHLSLLGRDIFIFFHLS